MIVAITGGSGFIGRHLVAKHLAMGDQVRLLTRNPALKLPDKVQPFIGGLLNSVSDLRKFVEGADVLYHCAAEIHDSKKMQQTNVEGTKNLIEATQDNVSRWIQLSSTGVYGPINNGVISEDSPLLPGNPYEISKAESDNLVIEASVKNGFDLFILRPSNVYANDMPNQSLFKLIEMIDKNLFFYIGKNRAIVNYIHVENVVDALILCAKTKNKNSGVYIVSDNIELEIFINYISTMLGKVSPKKHIPESLVRFLSATLSKFFSFPLTISRINALTNTVKYDYSKIQSELGFKNNISINDGVSDLTAFWKSNKRVID